MSTTIGFYTLGCKANQYDTEYMKELLRSCPPFEIVPFDDDPDVAVINTCTVTNGADRKSRQYIRRAAKTSSAIVVTGCYTAMDSEQIKNIEGVDVILTNSEKKNIIKAVQNISGDNKSSPDTSRSWDLNRETISRDSQHTRAFVKIQDGCDNNCSFCKVKFVRGPSRIKEPDVVVREVEKLARNGFKEIVLTGIDLAGYSRGKVQLSHLLSRISEIDQIRRIRLSSINPEGISTDLIRSFASHPKLCPYFHIPLQSGSDNILQKMNRNYTAGQYLEKVGAIRKIVPNASFGTDLLVGFPGEKDADVTKTEEIIKLVRFTNCHIFRYSPRDSTEAANYPHKIREKEKKTRFNRLEKLARQIGTEEKRKLVGESVYVMTEEQSDIIDGWRGYSRNYLDVHFLSPDGPVKAGRIVETKLTDVTHGVLMGEKFQGTEQGISQGG